MGPRIYAYILMAALAAILLLSAAAAQPKAGVSFTVSELSLDADLNSIALFDGGSIAVGRSGTIAIAYADGDRVVERPVDAGLLDVACDGKTCLAVGERGSAVIIDARARTMRPTKLSDDNLGIVRAHGGRFYIASSKQVMEYSPASGISAAFNIEALDILPADRLYILSRDGVYYVEGGELKKLASGSYSMLAWFNGSLHALSRGGFGVKGGLYRVPGGARALEGSYDGLASCGALYLFSGSTVYRASEDGRIEAYAVLPFKPRGAACRGGEVYAAGEKGYYARITRNNVELLFAPSGRYAAISADSGTAYIAGDKVLSYRNGTFRVIEVPSGSYTALSASGGALALLSQNKIILASEAGVRTLPYTASGYNDIWLSGDRILLAGRGLIEIHVDRMASREILQGVELYAVNGYGAAGKNVLVLLSSGSAEAIKVNVTLRGLDAIPCGLAAVGDTWLIAYRDGKTSYYRSPEGERLTSIAVKPDKAYALVGGADGGLYIWDGYAIQRLPYRAPAGIASIAWISGGEALMAAGGGILLYRDLGHGRPSLELQAPDVVKLYNGTERVVSVMLNPLNGYGGELRPAALPEGLDGLQAEPLNASICVRPLCPARADIRISAAPHASGAGWVTVAVEGGAARINVVVEPRARQPGGGASQPISPLVMTVIAGAIMVAMAIIIALKIIGRGRRAPETREAGPEAEAGEAEGGVREW
jgi:hypothetical protein